MDQNTSQSTRERVQADFEALPLDEKFASLFKMEMAAVSEGINLLVNDPMKVVNKVGDVIQEFGTKLETEARKAAASAREHCGTGAATEETSEPKKPRASKQKPPSANP